MISIIHATRRSQEAFTTAKCWLDSVYNINNVEYILSTDTSDSGIYSYFTEALGIDTFKHVVSDNRSAVDAFNNGAKQAIGNIFICISDDMRCFMGWDKALLKSVHGLHDFYLKVDDGLQPTLVTMPVFDRAYYNRLGYVWNQDYQHMFVDQEATAIAAMLGRYVKSNLLFKHAHYSTGETGFDDVNVRNNSTWAQGESLFNQRLAFNFEIPYSEIVKPYSEIVWH